MKDYLTIKEASDYIGVSTQTLRRWDKAGKLKSIRNNSNGYRYYSRSDLDPYRIDYQAAQTDRLSHLDFFQSSIADVEGNSLLRDPQKDSHRKVREYFSSNTDGHAILQIPVGCGKTGVIATLPFGIAKGRVLVIAPNLEIRKGIANALDIANPNNFWRKTGVLSSFDKGPFCAVLDGLDANLHDCNDSHFVIANIQQLASSADRWLPQFPPNYFDMILVDEGHHNVANSWTRVFEKFPNAKVVSLTATPFRSDGARPAGDVIYRYSFTKAMLNGYIKQIHSRNFAPSELYFTFNEDAKKHTLDEVLELREEAWFRKSVALSPECNRHIVDASLKYLIELRERTGFNHQIIAVACSVDHARQVRSLYEERGIKAAEIHSKMEREKQDVVLEKLRIGKLDCIVQVQMLGEGFDHPPLSIAAIFRPFRSLSPYIQFVGRAMRSVQEGKVDHPDNNAYIVSHVGLNNDEHWEDFREIDLDDQEMIRMWLSKKSNDESIQGKGVARRFDQTTLVENEVIGEFLEKSFLDPEDDRVLDEILSKEIAGGITLGSLLSKSQLRQKLRMVQSDKQKELVAVPVSPQRRRIEARKRLNERSKSVGNRVLSDLGYSHVGHNIDKMQPNTRAIAGLMAQAVNKYLNIGSGQRDTISYEQAEEALRNLDKIGDQVRNSIMDKGESS
ncbi:DEAD/DEAH box helicase family protein [Marinicella meishanensis]|uniref:DEAD/DEAH box helicase family protein n=1 Tax=Marinicella meishanensis TaxID=2873263 RepID=UPI001CC18CBC|nr:DEAD/DEAH box helicase family protein [Marinicella sp. NBU2979]